MCVYYNTDTNFLFILTIFFSNQRTLKIFWITVINIYEKIERIFYIYSDIDVIVCDHLWRLPILQLHKKFLSPLSWIHKTYDFFNICWNINVRFPPLKGRWSLTTNPDSTAHEKLKEIYMFILKLLSLLAIQFLILQLQ